MENLRLEPLVVIPVRNPLEIAASLKKRERFSEGKSLLLWLGHFMSAERESRGVPRCFVTYDQLLADWRKVIERIGTALGIEWARRLDESAPDVEAFLSSRLRHHTFDDAAVFARSDLPSQFKETSGWARRAAENLDTPTDLLDKIHDEILHSEPVFVPAIRALKGDAKRQSENLRHWIDVAVERYAIIEQLRAEIAALRAQSSSTGQRIHDTVPF